MSLLAVATVSVATALSSAVVAARALKAQSVGRRELAIYASAAIVVAALLAVCLLVWSSALGADLPRLLLPDLLAHRPGRAMFSVYALASAGAAAGLVALLAVDGPRRGGA